MRTRLLKEFRQLLPAWIAAIVLLPVAIFLNPYTPPISELYCLGLVLLAIAPFGREFSQNTFVSLLAQPISRERLWWEKSCMAFVMMFAVAVAFVIVWNLAPKQFPSGPGFPGLTFTLYAVFVALAGGLLGMLLLRQAVAAVLFAILVPYLLTIAAFVIGNEALRGTKALEALMAGYAIIAFALARHIFLKAEDYHPLGQNLALPALRPRQVQQARALGYRPLRTLVWKEILFQQITFLLAGILAILQLLVVISGRQLSLESGGMLKLLMEGFPLLWLVLPFLAGCSAVSEERRLGTLEPLLCLPVHRRTQFAVKFLVTLVCGLLLGFIVPWLLGRFLNNSPFATASTLLFGANAHGVTQALMTCLLVLLALVLGFYASTLSRHLLQSIGIAIGFYVGLVLLWAVLQMLVMRTSWYQGAGPLSAMLIPPVAIAASAICFQIRARKLVIALGFILGLSCLLTFLPTARGMVWLNVLLMFQSGVSALTILLSLGLLSLALAYQNFRQVPIGQRVWRRNGAAWGGTLLAVMVISPLIYHRVWEVFLPFEPAASPSRLEGTGKPVAFSSQNRLFALLPDGRLWSANLGYAPLQLPFETTIQVTQEGFFGASNWVSVVPTYLDVIGVQSDGSLWSVYWAEVTISNGVSFPRNLVNLAKIKAKGWRGQETSLKVTRIGTDSDWQKVSAGFNHAVALKRDGTLWGWGENNFGQLGEGVPRIASDPVRIGSDSDWTSVFATLWYTYAVKADGSVWRWGDIVPSANRQIMKSAMRRMEIPAATIQNLVSLGWETLALAGDGSVWSDKTSRSVRTAPNKSASADLPAGGELFERDARFEREGGPWKAVASGSRTIGALKRDGTLWRQEASGTSWRDGFSRSLKRVGRRTDWIAVWMYGEDLMALANDGTLCLFGDSNCEHYPMELAFSFLGPMEVRYQSILAPTRRAVWSVNVLETASK